MTISHLTWPASRLSEAVTTLAHQAGLVAHFDTLPQLPQNLHLGREQQGQWITLIARKLGLEAQAVEASHHDVLNMIRQAGPALVRLQGQDEDEAQFLVLLKGRWLWITVIGPNLSKHRVRPEVIRTALTHSLEVPLVEPINVLLEEVGVPEQRQAQARQTILGEQLGAARIRDCWLIRPSPATNFWTQMYQARLPHQILALVGVYVGQQLLVLGSWWLILRETLRGYFETTWLEAWILLLLTLLPLQIWYTWIQNQVTIGLGSLLKQRLLFGALRLDPETMRHEGVGHLLGRVMEVEAVELLALEGGLVSLIAFVQLLTAAVMLSFGVGGWLHALLLLTWVSFILLLAWRYFKQSQLWVNNYRRMTNDLVERMVGHRTRLAQEDFVHWHDEEDQLLAHYLTLSERLDGIRLQLEAFSNRGWLVWGLAGITPAIFVRPVSTISLALTFGGIIVAFGAFNRLLNGLTSIIGMMDAWEQFLPLFQAAEVDSLKSERFLAANLSSDNIDRMPLILARDLTFRYHKDRFPVLQGCSLQINLGDRILLEGPSGGGKSTLAALLAGLRRPDSGLLLLHGIDIQTIGAETWRQRVVAAPQFHENHIFTETLAFNLLMGRQWPASAEDIEEAETICHELGLGELLDTMPAGIQQMVGESGWQLSHGERSRVFIARALLQKADLIILDESFAALDPNNLQRALQCVLKRAPTLCVIAHP